jgi:hypothetical protein
MTKKLDGMEVINPVRSLRINVTPNDIKNGKPMDPSSCAAAQTLLRVTKASEVRVHRGVTYLLISKKWHRYVTSSGLRMETIIFDRGGTFIPGEYDLRPVPVSMIAGPAKKSSPSKGKTRSETTMATRRRVIPQVRRSARSAAETEE